MPNNKLLSKFDNAVSRTNLARSYRVMARLMVTQQSRDRLLRMAKAERRRSAPRWREDKRRRRLGCEGGEPGLELLPALTGARLAAEVVIDRSLAVEATQHHWGKARRAGD